MSPTNLLKSQQFLKNTKSIEASRKEETRKKEPGDEHHNITGYSSPDSFFPPQEDSRLPGRVTVRDCEVTPQKAPGDAGATTPEAPYKATSPH